MTTHTTNNDLSSQFCYDPILYHFYTSLTTMIYTIDDHPLNHIRSFLLNMLWSSTISSSHPFMATIYNIDGHQHNHRRPHHSWILMFSSQPITLHVNKQDTTIAWIPNMFWASFLSTNYLFSQICWVWILIVLSCFDYIESTYSSLKLYISFCNSLTITIILLQLS